MLIPMYQSQELMSYSAFSNYC